MSPRSLLIARIVVGVLAGLALLAGALAVVAIDGSALNGPMMATVVLGALAGWALDATWLAFAIDRLVTLGQDGEGREGEDGDGGRGPEPHPPGPRPPTEDADWWPGFERELRAHVEARERERIG